MSSTAAGLAPAPSLANLYRSLWRHAAGARLTLLAATAMLGASSVIRLVLPWLAAQAINALQSGGGAAVGSAALWVVAILGVHIAAWLLHGPGRVLERNVGIRVRRGISDALYAKLTRAPLAWHERQHSGEVQSRVAKASQGLHEFAQSQFIYLQSSVNFVGPVVALGLLSQVAGGIALVGYAAVALVIIRFDRALIRANTRENDAERRYTSGLLDFLGNIATVLSLRLQASTRRLLGARLDAVFVPLKRSIVVNEMKWCSVDLLGVGLSWLLVGVYVWQAHGAGGALMLGSVYMVHTYAQQAGGVIGSMAANFQGFARARTDYASADPIWQAPERRVDGGAIDATWSRIDIIDLAYEHAAALDASPPKADHGNDESRVDGEPADAPASTQRIDAPARGGLRGVSFHLQRGERVALVGPSGSGKSTLMRVLAGLYEPQRGQYAVDGRVQREVGDLGRIATLVPQEADVFEASVRENLTFGQPYDEAALRAAAHASGFDEVLARLPQGIATPITERGFNLSGGQRQRLCLARGLLAARDSSILMLDEPTSALDPLTEALLFDRLAAAFADACIVASVHRMSLLAHFDRVVLMADGRVLDSGSVAELEQRQPLFREMVRRPTRAAAPATALEAADSAAA